MVRQYYRVEWCIIDKKRLPLSSLSASKSRSDGKSSLSFSSYNFLCWRNDVPRGTSARTGMSSALTLSATLRLRATPFFPVRKNGSLGLADGSWTLCLFSLKETDNTISNTQTFYRKNRIVATFDCKKTTANKIPRLPKQILGTAHNGNFPLLLSAVWEHVLLWCRHSLSNGREIKV